ncbi:hypothetical protein ETAA8_61860 [Anatilimnocola aggregata]|uniref:Uncharacterized protein n=1 Tax=Anatilimnocola aggregata TaxID=2528021 RepID=A0A517YLE8_9BACT|nr:hypothetical protein [Anatilimnocola aggregata]QDU31033.1 hypothetical protein ETAA8_61860 [Anatilimnocola aggregata]
MSTPTTSPMRATRSSALRTGRAGRKLRRGYVTLFSIMLIVIGIVTLMLVVNWTYLVLVSRRTLQLTDNLALTSVSRLLDEAVLRDTYNFPATQADDLTEANNDVKVGGTSFLALNNAAAGPSLRPLPSQVNVIGARIENAAAPVGPSNYTTMPGNNQPYNTLVVEVFRGGELSSPNPVKTILRGFGAPEQAQITSSSYATLDSRVVGFRPTLTVNAPLAPLAVDADAWFVQRPKGALDDSIKDFRIEFDFTLLNTAGAGTATCALVGLNDDAPLTASALAGQVTDGIGPTDVNTSGQFGPLVLAQPLRVNATQTSPSMDVAETIAAAFNTVAASNNPRRAFPVYTGAYADRLEIVGFVGARILSADAALFASNPRLRVRLQPAFIVHSTVETQFQFPVPIIPDPNPTVPENLYIHKIRLTR